MNGAVESGLIDGEWIHIESPDYKPVSQSNIARGVRHIQKRIALGDTVLIHCKSGKGRSATLVAAYLIAFKGLSSEQAIGWIKNQRRYVSIAHDIGHLGAIWSWEKRVH